MLPLPCESSKKHLSYIYHLSYWSHIIYQLSSCHLPSCVTSSSILFPVVFFLTPSIITWVTPLTTHFCTLCSAFSLLSPLASLCFSYNSHLYFKWSPFYLGSNLFKHLLKSLSLCLVLCYWSLL